MWNEQNLNGFENNQQWTMKNESATKNVDRNNAFVGKQFINSEMQEQIISVDEDQIIHFQE